MLITSGLLLLQLVLSPQPTLGNTYILPTLPILQNKYILKRKRHSFPPWAMGKCTWISKMSPAACDLPHLPSSLNRRLQCLPCQYFYRLTQLKRSQHLRGSNMQVGNGFASSTCKEQRNVLQWVTRTKAIKRAVLWGSGGTTLWLYLVWPQSQVECVHRNYCSSAQIQGCKGFSRAWDRPLLT